jgi:hypothetical protein
MVHELVYYDLVPKKIRANRFLLFSKSRYSNAPNCDTCDTDLSRLASTYRALLPAHEAAIRIASCSPRRPDTAKDHSPGLVAFILEELGSQIIQPSYLVKDDRDGSQIPEEVLPETELQEGASIRVEVNRYERDPVAREHCIKHYGTACAACGRSLGDQYGPQVIGLIHVHHLMPLGMAGKRVRVNPIRDLRPVCPNCHAVIHSTSPPRTLEEMRRMINSCRLKDRRVRVAP